MIYKVHIVYQGWIPADIDGVEAIDYRDHRVIFHLGGNVIRVVPWASIVFLDITEVA